MISLINEAKRAAFRGILSKALLMGNSEFHAVSFDAKSLLSFQDGINTADAYR